MPIFHFEDVFSSTILVGPVSVTDNGKKDTEFHTWQVGEGITRLGMVLFCFILLNPEGSHRDFQARLTFSAGLVAPRVV